MGVPGLTSATHGPDRRFGQAIILFVVCLGLLLTLGLVAQKISLTGGLAFTLVALVLLPALVFVRLKGVPLAEALRLKRVPARLLVAGVAAGCGGWALAIALHGLVVRLIGSPTDMGFGAGNGGELVLLFAVVALLPGLCEEILFRGVIQGVLERRGPLVAIAATSALFGLFHLDPWRLLPAALLGAIFGWLVVRTGSLVPAIVAHVANNATALTVGRLTEEPPGWLLAGLAVLFACVAGAIVVLTDRPERPPSHPLALVPAGLSRPVAWIVGIALALVVTPILACGAALALIVTTAEATDDALAPHIVRGDTLVLVKSGSFAFDPEPGETVVFERGGTTLARVVASVDGRDLIVRDGENEMRVPEGDVIGELVHILPGPRGEGAGTE